MGKHSPSVATLRRYAQAVGCSVQIRLVRGQHFPCRPEPDRLTRTPRGTWHLTCLQGEDAMDTRINGRGCLAQLASILTRGSRAAARAAAAGILIPSSPPPIAGGRARPPVSHRSACR